MKTNIINIDERVFLIKFLHKSTFKKFIFKNGFDLMELLKNYDLNGIEYIKEFNEVKNNFVRVSKKEILNRFSWETEPFIYLKKHYYFN